MAGRQWPIECACLQWLYLDQDRSHSLAKDVNTTLFCELWLHFQANYIHHHWMHIYAIVHSYFLLLSFVVWPFSLILAYTDWLPYLWYKRLTVANTALLTVIWIVCWRSHGNYTQRTAFAYEKRYPIQLCKIWTIGFWLAEVESVK